MESLHSTIERAKRSPYDFLLATSMQKRPGENNYVVNCRLFSDSNLWELDKVLTRPKMLIEDYYEQEPEKTYSVKLPEGEAYDPPEGVKQCKKLCNDGEIERVTTKAKEAKTEHENYPSDNAEIKSVYYNMVRERFYAWFQVNMLDSPRLDRPERETKKQQYEELFNRYLADPNADPEEVKRALNDDPLWKGAGSVYLADNRRAIPLTREELRKYPGFSWIDPRNTGKD